MSARLRICLTLTLALGTPLLAGAMHADTDLWVPAAGRSGLWVTDLYIVNMEDHTVTAELHWLVRNSPNLVPESVSVALLAGETRVLPDVIYYQFGRARGFGAFRITADGNVAVNSRMYAKGEDATFGQGFPGVPAGQAIRAGHRAFVPGLSNNSQFRSNIYALAGPDGAVMTVMLRTPSGAHMASRQLHLREREPFLENVNDFLAPGFFDHATMAVEVTSGSAVVGASKADSSTDDPTTLESTVPPGDTTPDGVYQIALYDSSYFATGGAFMIQDGVVGELLASYSNYDKVDVWGDPECETVFMFGLYMPPSEVAQFENGVVFEESYASDGSGHMIYGIGFFMDRQMGMAGVVLADGHGFPAGESGCNGEFPDLLLIGGKIRLDSELLEKREILRKSLREKMRTFSSH